MSMLRQPDTAGIGDAAHFSTAQAAPWWGRIDNGPNWSKARARSANWLVTCSSDRRPLLAERARTANLRDAGRRSRQVVR